jgi:hypothetical protein
MPYADPNKSFDAAVRHLFRHLGDAKALRRNPLVRDLLGTHKFKNDDDLVAEIRDRILRLARPCCSEYAAQGFRVQARRRHAIICAICAGEVSSRTASRLKLSPRQYYRERHTVCARVASFMISQSKLPQPVETADPLELLLRRAEALGDQGFGKSAVGLLDRGWSNIPQGNSRLKARFHLIDALRLSGDLERAGRVLQYARAELSRDRGASIEDHDRAILVEARYDFANGHDAQGGTKLETLAKTQIAANRTDETALDTAVELGFWHCSTACFNEARKALHRARIVAPRLPHLSARQQLSLALLYAYCAEDLIDTYSGSHRRFHDCLEASIANGSIRGTVEAEVGLMGYYASAGCEDVALAWARRALDTARSAEGTAHLLFAAAWISTTLLKTRYWRNIDPLAFEAEALARPGTLHWLFIKESQAHFLARTERYVAAEESFAAAAAATHTLQNRKWQTILYRDRALLLKRLGSEESIAFAKRALELAEAGAVGAWSRSLTYQAAATVLGQAHVGRHGSSGAKSPPERRCPLRYAPLTLKGNSAVQTGHSYILP